jgi:hypothetical protein
MAVARLARPSVTTPIMRDHAKAVAKKEHQLIVPVVSAQGPTVMKHDWLGIPWAPVLVENVSAVSGGDESHGSVSPNQLPAERTGAIVRQMSR